MGRYYRCTCGNGGRYAYLYDASRSVDSFWSADRSVLGWRGSFSSEPADYTEINQPDCGSSACNGPAWAGRNWARTGNGGCRLFNSGYGNPGTWWIKGDTLERPENVAERNCAELYAAGTRGDGIYWVDPDGGGAGNAIQVYCDLTRDGGGWTLVAKTDGGGSRDDHESASDRNLSNLQSTVTDSRGTMGDAKRVAMGRFYRFTCGAATRYAYLFDTSRSVDAFWGSDRSVMGWRGGFSAQPNDYNENNGPDCGSSDCNGPAWAGRNWARRGYGGCRLFNSGYGNPGSMWVK